MTITIELEVPSEWRMRWPCSRLAGRHIKVVQDDYGDLLEFEVDRSPPVDVEASELGAILNEYLSTGVLI